MAGEQERREKQMPLSLGSFRPALIFTSRDAEISAHFLATDARARSIKLILGRRRGSLARSTQLELRKASSAARADRQSINNGAASERAGETELMDEASSSWVARKRRVMIRGGTESAWNRMAADDDDDVGQCQCQCRLASFSFGPSGIDGIH